MNRLLRMLSLTAALPLAACNPDVPARPTYDRDVQPILTAHCVRCHGAGGTLNAIPGIVTQLPAPSECYLQTYDNDPVGCTTVGTGGCNAGAASCGALFDTYINRGDDSPTRMPPKPSDPLSAWEKETLLRWGKLMPPPKN